VDVVVLQSGDAVTVTVIDGGAGFEPDAVTVDRLGLRVSVRSRIESVGGFVKIWSAPAQGTAIMLQLPYGRVS
jgi:signal transduction histidine kinase